MVRAIVARRSVALTACTVVGWLALAASPASAATPTLSIVATGGSAAGGAIQATAKLEGGLEASGQISFEVFGPDDSACTEPLAPAPAPAAVGGDGEYGSGAFTAGGAGSYRWRAKYSGDLQNDPAETDCSAISTVTRAAPTLGGTATPTATVGQSITDAVVFSGGFDPGGEIVFRAFGPDDDACSGPAVHEDPVPVTGNGTYAAEGFAPGVGLYRWTATYSGDANNEPAELPCLAANQTSTVTAAAPTLSGTATPAATVGQTITDAISLGGGFDPGGEIVFRAFGPDDDACSGPAAYVESVPVAGNGPYAPDGFAPGVGLYRWTVAYSGDANNQPVSSPCGAPDQSSVVGVIGVDLKAGASNTTIGGPVGATATIGQGGTSTGQILFVAFAPGDPTCSGPALFASLVDVSGDGTYSSASFVPSRVGPVRWTVSYSGDANHSAAVSPCGQATSTVTQAAPTIAGQVRREMKVGARFRDWATLAGGYAPTGTVTFQVYGPNATGCTTPVLSNTVRVSGNGFVSSDAFVATVPGRYIFVATYSGDEANRAATEPCNSEAQTSTVSKRAPKLTPRGRANGRQIAIRAHLGGAAAPTGQLVFRLYKPGDLRCQGKPSFSGRMSAKRNGTYLLAKFFASRRGVYRLSAGYSGDARNSAYRPTCGQTQKIRVG